MFKVNNRNTNNVWNTFKINNKDTRTTLMALGSRVKCFQIC